MSNVLIDHGTPPSIPTALLPYESYTEDPIWQTRFTAMWCAALAFCVLLAAPRALRLVTFRDLWKNGVWGVRVRGAYESVPQDADADGEKGKIPERDGGSAVLTAARVVDSVRLWSLPGITLNLGQSAFPSLSPFLLII
jgi:hypothetical protein